MPSPASLRAADDYFSLPVAAAAAAASTPRDSPGTPRDAVPEPVRRPSSAHPMVDQVRQSINSKQRSNTDKDSSRRAHAAIHEFRNSVEQKRALSQTLHDSGSALFLAQLQDDASVGLFGLVTSDVVPTFRGRGSVYAANTSGSSLGSFERRESESSDVDAPRIVLTAPASESPLLAALAALAALVSVPPIAVPPSPNALARGVAAINDSVAAFSLLLHATEEERPRRRKPPSEPLDVEPLSGSNPLDALDALEPYDTEDERFPKFPEISERTRKHRLFKIPKARPKLAHNMPLTVADLPEAQSVTSLAPRGVPVAILPQVKLKSTMRETSRRKEKKTAFNEDKPWKNHSDLDYVSDHQRKKYEALWASNKGLYVNRVVTHLVGVDYDKEESSDELESKKTGALTVREISERAARLSSKTVRADVTELGELQLHGLDHVGFADLMHGVVVQRIWRRSKLSRETLAQIWELVDYRKDGTLNKAEFIAGIWLVDQCLYGRKLPKRMPDLVWTSVGGLGLSLNVKRKRR